MREVFNTLVEAICQKCGKAFMRNLWPERFCYMCACKQKPTVWRYEKPSLEAKQ